VTVRRGEEGQGDGCADAGADQDTRQCDLETPEPRGIASGSRRHELNSHALRLGVDGE
jgi:hypothetical protein